ncbi:MAG: hypothetical protein JW741_12455 [Sedimentisphaerales bacterium]|nr:hypothetical protein [Sedimentisphaerales bacterium]
MLGLDFGTKKSSEKSQSYLPEQADWMKNLLSLYGGQVGAGQTSYEGDRVAGLTQNQQNLLGSLGNWAQYLQPTTGGAMYGQTGAALSDILAGEMGADPYTEQSINDLFKSAYEAPARKQWSEYTKPEIQESYSGPGYWGTARMNAVSKGAQDLGDTLSSQYGQLRYGAETANKALQEAAAGRALSAIPLAGDYISQPQQQALAGISGVQSLYGLSSAEQQQRQAEIASNMEKWAESQNITDPQVLQIMMELLGMQYTKSSSSGSQWSMGLKGGE